ncbi:MAG: carbamoyltransferase HypF, partial [Acidimicrobiaceae bacterium]|nr:carbamoyltransferase HypF [Acidimicrobiaceae bacterium]
ALERSVEQFQTVYGTTPSLVVADLHPGYHSRSWAEDHAGDAAAVELVQHHHAHVASVLAEHQLPLDTQVIGFAFDGTGYGEDGAIWGGEVLLGGYQQARRVAHLRYVPLPGGDGAVRKPYRMALAHLHAAGIDWTADLPPVHAAGRELAGLQRQLERGVACLPTSSMGRLFDAVSSLLGICQVAGYEAQAAVALEAAAEEFLSTRTPGAEPDDPLDALSFAVRGEDLDPAPVLIGLLRGRASGRSTGALAAAFHQAVAWIIADTAEQLRRKTGVEQVVLSGGVFQNGVLVRLARAALRRRAMRVYTNHAVPPNDGGLALGQAVVAASRYARGVRDREGRKR